MILPYYYLWMKKMRKKNILIKYHNENFKFNKIQTFYCYYCFEILIRRRKLT